MCKDTCSIQIRMEKGYKVVEEEAILTKAFTTRNNPANKIPTTGKTLQTRGVERLDEGGAIMLDRADKTVLSNADNVAN